MRSIETILRQFPHLTGTEILALQEEDKKQDKVDYLKNHAEMLDTIDDYNINGAYFKGTFGKDQYFYYRVSNIRLTDEGTVLGEVEKIVCFDKIGSLTVERELKGGENLGNYGLEHLKRISEEDFEGFTAYLENIFPTFWEKIDQSKFK